MMGLMLYDGPAEYSRTFMRIACHYFEGKTIHPVTPSEIKEDSSSLVATDSDASSSIGTQSEGVQVEDPQKVWLPTEAALPLPPCYHAADCLDALCFGKVGPHRITTGEELDGAKAK